MLDSASDRIVVQRIRQTVDEDVAESIKDELANLYEVPVDSISYSNAGKPAFGLAEVTLTVGIVGPLVYKFLEPLITTAGEAFRDKVLDIIRKTKGAPGGPYIGVSIEFGDASDEEFPDTPIRYYFYRQVDDQELMKRLKAADQHLSSLPPELLSERAAPVEYGFFWDRKTQRWRGCVWRQDNELYGEDWLPDDIYKNDD